jgi:hypothetical protein
VIDFRYHLVSIVSIFLALAVGIALGAGPLKSRIGDTFTAELTSLRADKAALKDQLDTANANAEKRDAFTTASNRVLLAGRLSGVDIAVVVLPGADNNLVESTAQSLTAAGAEISGTVRVQSQWTRTDDAQERAALVASLAKDLGLQDASPTLESVLAVALQPAAQSPSVSEDAARRALKALVDKGYLKQDPARMRSARAVVVVAAPQNASTVDQSSAAATTLARLAAALDKAGGGAVVASDVGVEPTTGKETSVVTVLRSTDSLDAGVTTIDDGSIPMGQASIILGIIEQMSGGSGRYGLGSDAKAVYPAVPGAAAG